MHSGRGISNKAVCQRSKRIAPNRSKLQHRRGSWETKCFLRTVAAWIWFFIAAFAAVYRACDKWNEGQVDAIIAGFELSTFMTVAIWAGETLDT